MMSSESRGPKPRPNADSCLETSGTNHAHYECTGHLKMIVRSRTFDIATNHEKSIPPQPHIQQTWPTQHPQLEQHEEDSDRVATVVVIVATVDEGVVADEVGCAERHEIVWAAD